MSKRILLVSDGANPLSTTGFGHVSKHLLPELLKLGQVHHWALGGILPEKILSVKGDPLLSQLAGIYPSSPQDIAGVQQGGAADFVYSAVRPDLVLIQADLGQVCFQIQNVIRILGEKHCPVVAYSPIEGAPLMPAWRSMMVSQPGELNIRLDGMITVTEYGKDVIEKETGRIVPYTYYGTDHDYWKPCSAEERTAKRELLGWSDKFVAMYVATNVSRKEHPRLFRAIREALPTIPNLYCYDHTKPFQNFFLGGHYLPAISDVEGVSDRIMYNKRMTEQDTSHYNGVDIDQKGMSLLDYYQCADVYVHVAHVEGFSLPVAEAMSCGLPVINVPYAAGWEVTGKAALGADIIDWGYNQSGTKVAHADPKSIAKHLTKIYRSPALRDDLRARSLARAAELPSWEHMAQEVGSYISRFL